MKTLDTVLFILLWGLLIVIVVLIGINRAMRRRHQRLENSLIDDCNASRDKLIAAKREIRQYARELDADNAIVEKAFKEVERLKESNVELLAKLADYDNKATLAKNYLGSFFMDVRSSGATGAQSYIRCAYDSLNQLTTE